MNELSNKSIIVAGGTGLVGTRLVPELLNQGAVVSVLSRTPRRTHLPEGAEAHAWEELPELIKDAHAVINLAGEGIADHRWNSARKRLLLESRIAPTQSIMNALEKAIQWPSVLINASAIGIYGIQPAEIAGSPFTAEAVSETQRPGKGFLPELCQAWEAATDPAQALGVRVVRLRTGVVLAREGGALPRLALPIRFWAGTALGNGRQGFSWIHIEDLVALILECIRNPAFEGPINATAPHPCSNEVFTRLVAKRLHRPVWPVPGFLTRSALRLLAGEMADAMLLGGAFVLPKKALDLGFSFRFPQAADALENLL